MCAASNRGQMRFFFLVSRTLFGLLEMAFDMLEQTPKCTGQVEVRKTDVVTYSLMVLPFTRDPMKLGMSPRVHPRLASCLANLMLHQDMQLHLGKVDTSDGDELFSTVLWSSCLDTRPLDPSAITEVLIVYESARI